ncbi:MAG: transcription antitermination factor NusB [Alphaproteobacteria bacterium]
MAKPAKPNKSLLRKRAARMAAVQALYAPTLGLGEKPPKELARMMLAQWRDSKLSQDTDWPADITPEPALLERILAHVVTDRAALDAAIDTLILPGWKKERMSPLMFSIFLAAGAEQREDVKKSRALIIREYTDIAASFLSEEEAGYIHKALNLLLDALA